MKKQTSWFSQLASGEVAAVHIDRLIEEAQEHYDGDGDAGSNAGNEASSGPGGEHSMLLLDRLLEHLRQLPVVAPLSGHMFIPKGPVRRYSRFATSAISWWITELENGSALHAPDRALCATLFLRSLDFLIARDAKAAPEANGLAPNPLVESALTSRTIRLRLQMLEQGKWLDAVDSAVADANEAIAHAAARRTEAQITDEETLSARMFEPEVYKVLHGDTRTGHRVLRSQGLHQLCPETVGLVRDKFINGSGKDSLADSPELRVRARRCQVSRVQPKLVAKVIERVHDCKASGISAWRNSRLKNIASSDAGLRALTS